MAKKRKGVVGLAAAIQSAVNSKNGETTSSKEIKEYIRINYGIEEDSRTISSRISYLVKQGKIKWVSTGKYASTEPMESVMAAMDHLPESIIGWDAPTAPTAMLRANRENPFPVFTLQSEDWEVFISFVMQFVGAEVRIVMHDGSSFVGKITNAEGSPPFPVWFNVEGDEQVLVSLTDIKEFHMKP